MRSNRILRLGLVASICVVANAWSMPSSRRPVWEIVGDVPLTVDATVPLDRAITIGRDLKVFESFNLSHDPALAELLDITDASRLGLSGFLRDRMRYVVGEFFSVERSLFVSQKISSYPNPTVWPDVYQEPSFNSGVLATNLGLAVYTAGKKHGAGLWIRLSDGRRVEVWSPRTGLVRIGSALFDPKYQPNSLVVVAKANSISRLQTLFHEARHSDGNGKSLGFPHALCPRGHDYEGQYACDRALNGPYTVGAEVLRKMIPECQYCPIKERETLKIKLADNLNRLLSVSDLGEPAKKWDASPEFAN